MNGTGEDKSQVLFLKWVRQRNNLLQLLGFDSGVEERGGGNAEELCLKVPMEWGMLYVAGYD